MQNRSMITVANPSEPFSKIVAIMVQGTITEALATSSAIREASQSCIEGDEHGELQTHMARAIIACVWNCQR